MDCKKWQKGKTMVAENDGNKHIIEQRERELIDIHIISKSKPTMETQMDGLPTTKSRPSVLSAFDEKNPKYYCCFRRLHIRKATRIVSVALIGSVLAILLYSFSRPPTVMVCSWLITVYALGIYGTLIYAVFKEKRTFTVSFLVFEAVFIITCGIFFMIFMLNAMFSTAALHKLAEDLGGIDPTQSMWDPNIRLFVLSLMVFSVLFICVHCWCFEIIYRFNQYLEERESSFAFHLEPEFRIM